MQRVVRKTRASATIDGGSASVPLSKSQWVPVAEVCVESLACVFRVRSVQAQFAVAAPSRR